MRITNIVLEIHLSERIDLTKVQECYPNRCHRKMINALVWSLPNCHAKCLVFAKGYLNIGGKKSEEDLLVYIKELRRLGYESLSILDKKVLTMSAVHTLTGRIRYPELVLGMGAMYEPEVFHAAMIHRGGVHFTIFTTGKVVMTGIKDQRCIDNLVYPTLMEMDIYSY